MKSAIAVEVQHDPPAPLPWLRPGLGAMTETTTVPRQLRVGDHPPADALMLYGIAPGHIKDHLVDKEAVLVHNLGDERPTYAWSAPEKAWVLVSVVRTP